MKELNRQLETLLRDKGAALVGVADLRGVEDAALPVGVAVAVCLPARVVVSIHDGPNRDYWDQYNLLNARLDEMVRAGAEFLRERGFAARARSSDAVRFVDELRSDLPHKTVATRAGLGWIGRCALLVTPQYGSAVRISALVTDAPLAAAQAVRESGCGGCTACQVHCPAGAVNGALWRPGLEREAMYDPVACREMARALCRERIGVEATICGKCIEVCPYTRRYLAAEKVAVG